MFFCPENLLRLYRIPFTVIRYDTAEGGKIQSCFSRWQPIPCAPAVLRIQKSSVGHLSAVRHRTERTDALLHADRTNATHRFFPFSVSHHAPKEPAQHPVNKKPDALPCPLDRKCIRHHGSPWRYGIQSSGSSVSGQKYPIVFDRFLASLDIPVFARAGIPPSIRIDLFDQQLPFIEHAPFLIVSCLAGNGESLCIEILLQYCIPDLIRSTFDADIGVNARYRGIPGVRPGFTDCLVLRLPARSIRWYHFCRVQVPLSRRLTMHWRQARHRFGVQPLMYKS